MSNQILSAQKLVCFDTKIVHEIDQFFMLLIANGIWQKRTKIWSSAKKLQPKMATELHQKFRSNRTAFTLWWCLCTLHKLVDEINSRHLEWGTWMFPSCPGSYGIMAEVWKSDLPVVHDDKKFQVWVLFAEVDQSCRFSGSGKGHNLDDVTRFWIKWMVDDPKVFCDISVTFRTDEKAQ
jgi:hypothetical protein